MKAWNRFTVMAVVVLLSTGVASAGDFCFNSYVSAQSSAG